jgi:hypothetical protein
MFDIKNPKNGSILQVAEFDFHFEMNYYEAKNACKVLDDGWRLPTISEAELIYKQLHLKRKGNFEKKGVYEWYGSYWCEKDSYGLSQVFSFKDGYAMGNAEAYKGYVRVVRNFREKVVSDTYNMQKNPKLNIKAEYVKKISDKFSKTVEYRMKESVILNNNKGLPYDYKFDINIRVFVENNDFMNSKIVLALTYYAPEPGTGTILHESFADVMIDNKDVLKFDNEYAYSGLDSYYKLEIYNEILGQKSSRTEQIQFNIDLATLLKIVNAKTFEIRFNKKWEYGGKITNMINFIGFYNGIFDPDFKKDELLKCETNISNENDNLRKKLEFQISTAVPKKAMPKRQEKTSSNNPNCFVITATMGNPYHPIVDEFRAYRDSKLLTNILGKAFVIFYYKIGPFAAFVISKSAILRKLSFNLFVNPVYKRIKNDQRKKQE